MRSPILDSRGSATRRSVAAIVVAALVFLTSCAGSSDDASGVSLGVDESPPAAAAPATAAPEIDEPADEAPTAAVAPTEAPAPEESASTESESAAAPEPATAVPATAVPATPVPPTPEPAPEASAATVALPAIDVVQLSTGANTDLASISAPGATLLWFWAPH